MKSLRVLVLVLCASTLAFAADPEFKGIVHSIEHTYCVHHLHIPFLGWRRSSSARAESTASNWRSLKDSTRRRIPAT